MAVRTLFSILLGLLAAAPLHAQAAPESITIHLDAAQTEIHWTLKGIHNVHGTFTLKGGLIVIVPSTGDAEGEVVVGLASGASGNHARDAAMQKVVLESNLYPEAIFHPSKIDGALKSDAPQIVTVEGTFTIHGKDHPMNLQAKIDMRQGTATLNFAVPYVAWGMKDPSKGLLRVGKTVYVDVIAKGTVAATKS
jgi:polyisoprenoid-binding protein YceI